MRARSTRTAVAGLALFLACAASTPISHAATLDVPSVDYPDIQTALDAAVAGDTIVVADGTYTGINNKLLDFGGKDITLTSSGGPNNCIIDCEGIGRAFVFYSGETADAVLDGFTITNGRTFDEGGGIQVANSSPTIRNCKVIGCTADSVGGGIFFSNSNSTLENCSITGNDSLFSSGGGLGFVVGSDVTLINCTITGNVAPLGSGGAAYSLSSSPTFWNCIMYNDSPDEVVAAGTAAPTLNYCDIQDGWGGAGTANITGDPLFTDPGQWDGGTWTEGNYQLQSGSPCIDNAYGTDGITVPTTDILGNARCDDPEVTNTGVGTPTYVDRGAYERQIFCDDVLWRNSSTGQVGIWFMSGLTVTSADLVDTVAIALGWVIWAVGDFDGDGNADILWRNTTSGQLAIWIMDGATRTDGASPGTVAPALGWVIWALGDFDGDGNADILWRNTTTGQLAIWFMDGLTMTSGGSPGTVAPALGWIIQGVGDFDGDGKDDILWRNATTGLVAIWFMDGLTMTGGGAAGAAAVPLTWAVWGVGDFDGDGKDDILWRSSTTGMVAVWIMDGLTMADGGSPGTIATALGWFIWGVGDFNGDGKDDVLWYSPASGEVAMWIMDGLTVADGDSLGTLSTTWQIQGVGNFDGSGN